MLKKILACFCLTLALLVGVTEPNLTQAQATVPVRTITKAQVEPLPAKVRMAIYLDALANGGGTYDQNGWRSIYDCAHGTILEVEYGRKQAAI